MTIGGIDLTNIQSNNINTNLDVKILDKTLAAVQEGGESMLKMMEQSINPNLGNNVDTYY